MPAEADYNIANGMFKSGRPRSSSTATGRSGDYAELFGDQLGVGPLPQVTGPMAPSRTRQARSSWSQAVADDAAKQAAVLDFMTFDDTRTTRSPWSRPRRLPANNEAIADPVVTGDPFLAGSAAAVQNGMPQPTNLEMRCVFDSMNTGVRDLFTRTTTSAAIAAAMQSGAEAGVAPGGEWRPGRRPDRGSVSGRHGRPPIPAGTEEERRGSTRYHRAPPCRLSPSSSWSSRWPSSRASCGSSSCAGGRRAWPCRSCSSRPRSSDSWSCSSTRSCGSSTSRSRR